MSPIKFRNAVAAGVVAAATTVAAPAALAQPIVTTTDTEVRVRTESLSESSLVVRAFTAEQTLTRIRLRLNRAPAVSGGCTIAALGAEAIVDCPRKGVIQVEGTNSGDTVDLNLNGSLGIRSRLFGHGGSDVLLATGANDSVYAGSGNDEVRGFSGNDNLRGQDGDDDLYGYSGGDVVQGGNNADYINGGADGDDLYARDINNPHTDDEWFNNDYFHAEDDVRDDIFCDSTPWSGHTPGVFDSADENIGDYCRFP